jgi:pullulanase
LKKRVRNILALVLSLVFFLSSFLNLTHFVPAATEIKINLHYHRYIGDYEGWNVWSWINGSEGSAYEFNGEDEFGKVASYSISVSDKDEQIGFILRHSTDTNPWDKKDCNEDRFIDIKQEKDGVIDVYVLQDQNVFSYQPEGINLNPGVTKASFVHNRKIAFSVPSGFDSTRIDTLSKIHVFDNTKKEYPVESLSCEQGKNVTNAEILMKEELPLTGTYTLYFEGMGNVT